ncbi:MAG: Mov34/MPN/PAD-1 family protein [Cellvibrionaceae bacterium]
MLVISDLNVKKMFSLAKEHHPIEACGIITAKRSSPQETRFIPMQNIANSKEFFQFDPVEQLRVWKEIDNKDEYLWVIFHSHTSSEAYPSRTDINFSSEPDSHYVIISTDNNVTETMRSFRVSAKRVVEENIRIQA